MKFDLEEYTIEISLALAIFRLNFDFINNLIKRLILALKPNFIVILVKFYARDKGKTWARDLCLFWLECGAAT